MNEAKDLNKQLSTIPSIHFAPNLNLNLDPRATHEAKTFRIETKMMEKEKKRLRKRFSKDREAIKDIGGFRFRGCLQISNPCGITTRKKAREGEERADQSARYLTNTVC